MTIELQGVKVSGDRGVEVIRGVDMGITRKSLLLGPNGSGKTTLLRAICGVIDYHGHILVDGQEVRGLSNYTDLSCNLPEVYTLGLTVRELVWIYEELKGVDGKLVEGMLREVGFSDLSRKFYNLSAGQNVLVRTAITLASGARKVVVDEPFENVDYAKRRMVVNWLKEQGEEGLVVTHELDMLESFDSSPVYLIFDGRTFGPVGVEEFLESSVVDGEAPSAQLVLEVRGRKFSLVKGGGKRMRDLGNLDKLYLDV